MKIDHKALKRNNFWWGKWVCVFFRVLSVGAVSLSELVNLWRLQRVTRLHTKPVSGRTGRWIASGSGRSWSTPVRPTRRSRVDRGTWFLRTWSSGSPATQRNWRPIRYTDAPGGRGSSGPELDLMLGFREKMWAWGYGWQLLDHRNIRLESFVYSEKKIDLSRSFHHLVKVNMTGIRKYYS